MAWFYRINSHCFQRGAKSLSEGVYSGAYGPDQNCAKSQGKLKIGPIPEGTFNMTELIDSPTTGPNTIVLSPDAATRAYIKNVLKRDPDSFRIHGDNISKPGHGSEGCVVAPPAVRITEVWDSMDRVLTVTADNPKAPQP